MDKKIENFAKKAIINGYTGRLTEGWDWIKDNITELDFIFQTEEYKKQKGYVGSCLKVLIGKRESETLEEGAIGTAWYLNNDREYKKKKNKFVEKMSKIGYIQLENNKKYDDKKAEFKVIVNNAFGGESLIDMEGKIKWSEEKKELFIMKKRSRTRGFWNSEKVFAKIIK